MSSVPRRDGDLAVNRAARERSRYNEGLKRTFYNRLFKPTHHLYRRHRYDRIGRILRADPPREVLEIGGVEGWRRILEDNQLNPERLECINISEAELDKAAETASGARLQPTFRLMNAEALDYPDDSFDLVCGVSILHHIHLERALREIHRVLRPGGRIVFCEPMDLNPVGRLVRALTPQARTDDERPFKRADLELIERQFECDFDFEQMLSVPAGIFAGLLGMGVENGITRNAFAFDEWLKMRWPALRPYFRLVTIIGRPR